MEQERFDQLARGLAAGRSRRGMVRQLAGAALGGALAAVGVGAAAAKPPRSRNRHGSHHPSAADATDHTPPHPGTPPTTDQAQRHKQKHPCPAGQTRCTVGKKKHGKATKACVDLQTDSQHCGSCATKCAADETCQAGQCSACVPDCAGKQCGADGCGGGCGSCPSGQTCQQGQCVCVPDCSGKTCGGDGCGGSCGTCSADQQCHQGQCACPAGQTACNGQCVNSQTDATNCGACGNVCDLPHTTVNKCVAGGCAPSQCESGWRYCGGDFSQGCATDLTSDPTNCGGCGNVCPAAGAHETATCSNGGCGLTCDAGWADCNNDVSDGCETPLGTSANCLACGDSCAGFANECNAGLCSDSGCFATPTNDGGSCQGGTGVCNTGNCVPNNICIEALQSCNQGGTACCEGRVCQAFEPGCWGPQYCCRASGESCTNACDCCSVACSGPWVNGAGHCL
jgi:hypothetical protein